MAWPGGKDGSGVAQRLINEIPPHDVFVSAFLGDCAILRKIKPARLTIGIDLDRENIQRWARERPFAARLYCCDAIEWLRMRFDYYLEILTLDLATGDDIAVCQPTREATPKHAAADPVANYAADYAGRTFVYVDPPYLLDSRSSPKRMYAHELPAERHRELLATLVKLPCLVMVSHYPHPLYAEALRTWRTFTFRSITRSGKQATEQVWCNYPPPDVLHDSRYLGRNKREREKIRRRVRNWSRGLAKMPPLERQAILDELAPDVAAGSKPANQ